MTAHAERLAAALVDRYSIERELGQGGMATVYLAHDVKHDRKVALKVLRPELAAVIGAERFLQEIKVTANLQHSNILPLYDSGRAVVPPLHAVERGSGGEEYLYYVMPYVEGESLRDRISRQKQLGVEEAVDIIRDVAGALDFAHRRGVIHRDIKPENILLQDGNPLVADFGIALAVSHAGGSRLTETGLSIGTPHYMSPEQAMGDRELDARSDIYSLGAMLYELLVGEPPFTGPTAQSIVAKVITEQPPMVSTRRDTVPRHVSLAIYKALAKLPADRYPSAISFGESLVRPQTADTDAYPLPPGETIAAPAKTWNTLTVVLMVLLVLAALLALWGWLRPAPAPAVSRFAVALPEEQGLVDRLFGPTIALSPAGDELVYVGPGAGGAPQLWRRAMNQLSATPIPGTHNAVAPSVSADGQSVAFVREGLHVVSLAGGPPLALASDSVMALGTDWGEDGYLYFLQPGAGLPELVRIPAGGGERERLATTDTAASRNNILAWPDALPAGRGVLVTVSGSSAEDTEIGVVDIEARTVRPILRGIYARYVPTGHIVYTRGDGALLVAPFDERSLEVTGPSVPMLEGIVTKDVGASEFTVAGNGTLVYVAGAQADEFPVWVDREGTERPVADELVGQFGGVSVSPEGGRLAFEMTVDGNTDIWIYDLDQATFSRLTFDDATDSRPVWEPDGRRVTFQSWRTNPRGLWRKLADGSAPAESLLVMERVVQQGDWSRDGRWLVAREGPGGPTGRDIHYMEVGVDSVPRPLLVTRFNELDPQISPDGRWLLYQSSESGRDEVYIRSFPEGGGRWQVSTEGGIEPRWAHSGREVFYRQGDGRFVAAQIRVVGGSVVVGARQPLFAATNYNSDNTHHAYDVAPDDQRFLFIRQTGGSRGLVVVLNWFEELKRRTAP